MSYLNIYLKTYTDKETMISRETSEIYRKKFEYAQPFKNMLTIFENEFHTYIYV